ncbi:MAG: hypothetical protein PHX76_02180 [Patescibacteria group bacterium]|jgi:hypothetical protein|nr:hypothetical protein [Patescibacteria group bacterium]
MEKMKEQFYQEKPRFSIKPENIIALEELMNYLENKEFFKVLNWPLEVQGSGRIIEGDNFEVRYPKGDKFFSFAAIIHELGHLRQDEFININPEQSFNIQKEQDAYSRGWSRAVKYYPEFIERLEGEFQKYKGELKIEDFNSFKDLYDFFCGTIDINLTLEKLGDSYGINKEIEALKLAGIDKFFDKINRNKTGTIINEEEANDLIIRVSENIAKE